MIQSRISTALVLLAALVGFFCFDISFDEGKVAFGGQMVVKADSPTVTLEFSTFLGSNTGGYAELWEPAFDSAGNIVVVGAGNYSPGSYPGVPVHNHAKIIDNSNVFVAKLSADATRLLWIALLGGTGTEKGGYGVGVDAADNVYVTGTTQTSDFKTTPGAFDETYNGGGADKREAFLAKLSPDGQQLIYSTYLGGSQGLDTARGGLAVDSQGYAYVVGVTQSRDFLENASSGNPSNKVNSFIDAQNSGDGFVTKVSPDGKKIVYTRFVGSPVGNKFDGDVVTGIRVDAAGNAYITVLVRGPLAQTTDSSQYLSSNGGGDLYLAKISPDGQNLVYARYFGTSADEGPEHRLALDNQGNIYVTGETFSQNFPVTDGSTPGQNGDGFLIKFNTTGQKVFATYISGLGEDNGYGPVVDANGNIYVTGYTESSNFETTPGAYSENPIGGRDGIVRIYSPTGQLLYSTFYGGSGFDRPRGLGMDQNGNVVIVGYTQSSDFPTSGGVYDRTHNGGFDVFVTKFAITSAPLPIPPNNVKINGPPIGLLNANYIFTAAVDPVTSTQPITYVWQATDQTQITHANISSSGDMATFNWSTGGVKTVRVTAANPVNTVVDTHTFIAVQNVETVYLPTILKTP